MWKSLWSKGSFCLAASLLICAVFSCSTLPAADLHTIIVGDTDATDLMPGLKFDVNNMRAESKNIAKYSGLKLKEKVFLGDNSRTSLVLSQLKNLQVQSNDTILFYFTGHGYRTRSKLDNPWPNLFFTFEDYGIDVNDVVSILSDKKARFVLIINDCCNTYLSEAGAPFLAKEMVHGFKATSNLKKNYQNLFLNSRGIIVIASSKIGQSSLCTEKGSLYTLAFLASLDIETKKAPNIVSWQTVLDQATYKVELKAQKYDEEQNPIFLIE